MASPIKAEDLFPIFSEELSRQEVNREDAWIEIPEPVREKYAIYRSTPLVRAYELGEGSGYARPIFILRTRGMKL